LGLPQDRLQRLAELAAHLRLTDDYPLLKAAAVPPGLRDRVTWAVRHYLWVSLSCFFPERNFDLTADLLERYAGEIAALPNITPNGLVLPKRENFLAFNQVHQSVVHIFDWLGMDRFVEHIHAPINVRLVSGRPDPKIDSRPRASVKPHSDIWAGEPAAAIMLFISVLGDPLDAGVRFLEPASFPAELMHPLTDFDHGASILRGCREYAARLASDKIFLTDPFLIHQTMKSGKGQRLSIDFRFTPRQKVASDRYDGASRRQNYISLAAWREIGRTRLITTDAPLAPFSADNAVKDAYAAEFKMVSI
jgi:hypothetical protein